MWASILPAGSSVEHNASGKAYVHLIMHDYFDQHSAPGPQAAKLRIGASQSEPVELSEGDGLFIEAPGGGGGGRVRIENVGARDAEFLVFDV